MMRVLVLGLAVCFASQSIAQETPSRLEWQPAIKPEIVQRADGLLEMGGILVDPAAKTATFPVLLNDGNEGELIEYMLVHENGKTHESLLKTEVQPFHLHTAMLLLGISKQSNRPVVAPPSNIDDAWLENSPAPIGAEVNFTIVSGDQRIPVEDWIWDEAREATMPPGNWRYTGSYFDGAAFIAQVDGSFASIITDPAALINSGDARRVDDQNWLINFNASTLPKPGEVILLEIAIPAVPVDLESAEAKLPASKPTESDD
ncbi:YdjY domain-containing protein [Cerasicoccus fimbriatus]|uniref:YdjY domain-containing protein n=1 Tax=Cerasicoccus fimbriatus TaxID=3014554 RepID=UPI0022B433A7|nr:YdjY domain-containing protein [Cerasicoccus sp. TK19100]